jgi:hypothetical protein
MLDDFCPAIGLVVRATLSEELKECRVALMVGVVSRGWVSGGGGGGSTTDDGRAIL